VADRASEVFDIPAAFNQMLNVSTLLLDDALKPATPLIAPLDMASLA